MTYKILDADRLGYLYEAGRRVVCGGFIKIVRGVKLIMNRRRE
jgi:hypothetical protein